MDVEGSEGEPCCNDSAGVPQAVVNGRNTASMLRMADLGQQERAAELRQSVSESDHKSRTDEHAGGLGSALQRSSNDENDTADTHGYFTALPVR